MRTLGAEREFFICQKGIIVPRIDILLPVLQNKVPANLSGDQFTFELFAGQVEDRSRIVQSPKELVDSMKHNEEYMSSIAEQIGLSLKCVDYVTEEELGVLEVNPFSDRHGVIWRQISHQRRVSASQVAAVHIHVSVSPIEAVKVLNYCRLELIDELICMGDFSNGKRISSYRQMAETDGEPPIFSSPTELFQYIESKGGERDVWDLVRYKPSTGTIEFRMFGATSNSDSIFNFATTCLRIVNESC